MREGRLPKKRMMMILAALLMFMLSGCQKLMEQEVVDPAKTVGKKAYIGFDHLAAGYGSANVTASGGVVCNRAKVAEGLDNWSAFAAKTAENTPCSIRIMQKINSKDAFFRDLIYDGESYRLVISTNPREYDYTYKYLLDLSGRRTKKSRKSRLVIVTNDKDASFEDVIESIGRNKEDQKLDFQLVFRHQ